MEQALQGNIGRFTLPEIFQLVANSRKTGTLGIQKDDDIVMVYFKSGRIIYGYGPRQTYHIGQLLKDRGRLSAQQLEDAVNTQAREASSKRLGQILMEKKYIDRADLENVVRSQVEELIYSLLSWETGTFKFYENQYPTEEEITVNISVENAILEGYRRIDELNRIKEAMPDFNIVPVIAATPPERKSSISLNSEEWNLLSLVDGKRTIEEIVQISPLARMDTLRKLGALKLAGLLKVGGKKQEPTDHLQSMVDRVSQLLEEYLSLKSKPSKAEKTTVENIQQTVHSRLSPADLAPNSIEEER
ncbi:MAG: hypothetical protein CVT49_11940 [candidate division Zixibacteria bacterium HGW-Zixibacteria-1]|nr:MAG: hypothetical protein CVT49_11940 [candidate division Zixibacteria bacterium HGW-Zixibacteria-1]